MALTQKTRRHSGRVCPRFRGKKEVLISDCLEPQVYWNDWYDYRDGIRVNTDKTLLRSKHMWAADAHSIKCWNTKIRSLIQRRKARRMKNLFVLSRI